MTVGAGEFVMVGGASGKDFDIGSGAFLDSLVSCPNPSSCSTGGTILIMTGSSSAFTCGGSPCNTSDLNPPITGNTNGDLYPGLMAQLTSNQVLAQGAVHGLLTFGSVSLLTGADKASAAVTGLIAKNLPQNSSDPTISLANTLGPFDGVVIWQDQANSTIKYTSLGNVDTSCSVGIDNPCTKSLPISGSEGITLQASSGTGIQGIVYQPRGGFIQTQSGGTIAGPIQIITGAISLQGGGTINTTLPPTSAQRRVALLVE